jgi:HK97 family phage major capsid protein
MKMIAATNRTIQELDTTTTELDALTSKPQMNNTEHRRYTWLLSKVSLLKAGLHPNEIRRYEREKLLAEAGLPRLPERARGRLEEEIENEWRQFILTGDCPLTRIPKDSEMRDITSGSEAGTQSISFTQEKPGGAFVPQGLSDRFWETAKLADDLLDPAYSSAIYTHTGANTPYPSIDDVSVNGQFLGEGVQGAPTPINNFGVTQLNAWTCRSLPVPISIELEMDSAFPWGQILEKVFAGRLSRAVGQKYVSGSGVNQPTGLITGIIAAGVSPQVAIGSSTNDGSANTGSNSIGTTDLTKLKHSIDPAYQRQGVWYLNDSTLEFLEQFTDKYGRPIIRWGGSDSGSTGDYSSTPCILGRPVAVCQSFPSIASGNNSVVFGDPSFFITRRVNSSFFIRRYSQLPQVVERGMVAFEAWMRTDSNVIIPDVAYSAFAILQNHS